MESILQRWMQQPGLVKQLQLYLALALILIILLLQQLLVLNYKFDNSSPSDTSEPEQVIAKEERPMIEEADLRDFVNKYLENFFAIDEESQIYIAEHTDQDLYHTSLEQEIINRRELGLESEFKLSDLYMESMDSTDAKAIILGQEIFPNGDYQARNFTIELVINVQDLRVESIPIFKIQ